MPLGIGVVGGSGSEGSAPSWVNRLNDLISQVGTTFTNVWTATHGPSKPKGTGSSSNYTSPTSTTYKSILTVTAFAGIGLVAFFLGKSAFKK